MLGKTYDSQVCSIARALEVVGERWSVLIIRDALFAGASRYSEFQQRLGIATNILQARLDGFVEAGIMERVPSSERHEYVLTEKGRDLAPALMALTEWGDRWAAPHGPPILYRHTTCGSPVGIEIDCETCRRVHDPTEVQVRPGPGMPAERLQHMQGIRARRRTGDDEGRLS